MALNALECQTHGVAELCRLGDAVAWQRGSPAWQGPHSPGAGLFGLGRLGRGGVVWCGLVWFGVGWAVREGVEEGARGRGSYIDYGDYGDYGDYIHTVHTACASTSQALLALWHFGTLAL